MDESTYTARTAGPYLRTVQDRQRPRKESDTLDKATAMTPTRARDTQNSDLAEPERCRARAHSSCVSLARPWPGALVVDSRRHL